MDPMHHPTRLHATFPSNPHHLTHSEPIIMTTRARRDKGSILDDRMHILNGTAAEASAGEQVFRTVCAILSIVKDKMIDNEDAVQLSEYCFATCETLKTAISGENADGLSEFVMTALEDLKRIMGEIERTLRRVASTPRAKFSKEKVESNKLEIEQILGDLSALSPPLAENGVVAAAIPTAPDHPGDLATVLSADSACARLVRRAFSTDELQSLVETMFSNDDEGNMIHYLSGEDAQNFANVIDGALETLDLSQRIRRRCIRALYRTCGRNSILPESFQIPLCYDRQGVPLCQGGFADVWKGRHRDRDVAVKVIRTASYKELQKIVGRFCKEVVTWKALRHPNVLPLLGVTMNEFHFAMVSEWMENGNMNEFLKANPDADRLGLLADVAKGLIYIHSQEMIHGDLKGANILIDPTQHARVADFSLLTIVSDSSNQLSSGSHTQGGTARWMGPELIDPKRFGLETSRPMRPSDCYALGMVIYEAITGHFPYHKYPDLIVFLKVLDGKRPTREAGFADELWEMLELCWEPQPSARPSIEAVLERLESVSNPSEPPLPGMDGETEDGDCGTTSNSSYTGSSLPTEGDSHYYSSLRHTGTHEP